MVEQLHWQKVIWNKTPSWCWDDSLMRLHQYFLCVVSRHPWPIANRLLQQPLSQRVVLAKVRDYKVPRLPQSLPPSLTPPLSPPLPLPPTMVLITYQKENLLIGLAGWISKTRPIWFMEHPCIHYGVLHTAQYSIIIDHSSDRVVNLAVICFWRSGLSNHAMTWSAHPRIPSWIPSKIV